VTTLALTFAVAALSLATDGTPKSELDRYQGTWVVVSEEFEGRKVSAERLPDNLKELTHTVRGDTLFFTSHGQDRSATIQLNPNKSPKTYDLVRDDGRPLEGIYTWEGDNIKICTEEDQGDRPTAFKTGPGSKIRIRVFKRK
jgi:uncharacterized protein (TIGR03067 family)